MDMNTGEFYNPVYLSEMRNMIANWKDDDRLLWLEERKALHALNESRYRAGRFGSIGKEIFLASQPLFYIEGYGVSGVKSEPFAKVKLSSSLLSLDIDLGDTFKRISKHKRRKAVRHGKSLPDSIEADVFRKVLLAVRDYFSH